MLVYMTPIIQVEIMETSTQERLALGYTNHTHTKLKYLIFIFSQLIKVNRTWESCTPCTTLLYPEHIVQQCVCGLKYVVGSLTRTMRVVLKFPAPMVFGPLPPTTNVPPTASLPL